MNNFSVIALGIAQEYTMAPSAAKRIEQALIAAAKEGSADAVTALICASIQANPSPIKQVFSVKYEQPFGETLVGLYSTEEKALAAKEALASSSPPRRYTFSRYSVIKYEVDKEEAKDGA